MAALVSCSRESSIKENVNLRNNHSVVFAFNKPFENPTAFADSIANLASPDSVLVYDTLTVTVNDSIYFMGFLRYNSDKIYRYLWHFEQPRSEKDSTKKKCEFYFSSDYKGECSFQEEFSQNGQVHSHAYPDTGVYSPLFVAIDGNNARDTAGIGQYIRVINTPPVLRVPKDTLWTRNMAPITFPIFALDSFGTIKSLRIDLDAAGKDSSKIWKLEYMEGHQDSLLITIPYDKAKVDTLGNQMIYVIIEDDDGNKTKDSVYLHFNQLPKLTIISPNDDSEENILERVLLLYSATDIDNPADLRYFVHAANPIQKDTLGTVVEVVPQLTAKHEIANNIQATRFEAVTAEGENKLGLTGLIYWDVWVTDGYDTVMAEKINVKDTLRPRRFLLVNPNKTEGSLMGTAKMEGRTDHSNIIVGAISLANENNIYKTTTNKDGKYTIVAPAGSYRIVAVPPYPTTYDSDTASTLITLRKGQDQVIKEELLLKDIVKPTLETSFKATEIHTSTQKISIITRDEDSGIDLTSVKAFLNGNPVEWNSTGETTNTWVVNLTGLVDGTDTLKVVAKDIAGNEAEPLVRIFTVKATSIVLRVGTDQTKQMVNQSGTLSMSATIKNATTKIEKLTWVIDTTVTGKKSPEIAVADDKAVLNLNRAAFEENFGFKPEENQFYRIAVKTSTGLTSNTIQVGYYGTEPIVYFERPHDSLKVSIKDPVEISIVAIPNNGDASEDYTLTVDCGGDATGCPTTTSGTVSWNWTNAADTAKVKKLKVTLTNKDGKKISDQVTVFVSRDKPKLSIITEANVSYHQKISTSKNKTTVGIRVEASDVLGTLDKVTYGCTAYEEDANHQIKIPLEKVLEDNTVASGINKNSYEGIVTLTMPGEVTYLYKCGVKAIDDDGEFAVDSIAFSVHKYEPYVSLNVKSTYTTINDEMNMKFIAQDTAGTIKKYLQRCSYNKTDLQNNEDESNWTAFDGSKKNTTVVMPSTPSQYYCAVRVIDDDDFVGVDITTFDVLQASPRQEDVKAHAVRSPVSINDADTLDASAKDLTLFNGVTLKGYIASYQWGCADKASDVKFSAPTSKNDDYIIKVPSKPNDKYTCILQVTDDDGNTVRDTAYIQVLLDPPTVKVDRDEAVGRVGYNLLLDADAYDKMGSIVKNEWSCGTPTQIERSWKTTPSLNTTWKIEAVASNYMCVVRVTDDDGNTARDTMKVTISTSSPVITVEKPNIVVPQGQSFDLNARKNDDVWSNANVSWFGWQCFDAAAKKELEPLTKYDFIANGNSFAIHKSESLTEDGNNLYCVVSAQERNTGAIFSDTTTVTIMKQENRAKGVITAADTVGLWSGDEQVNPEAKYFYSSEWGGMNSIMGLIGDVNMQRYLWTFHNVTGVKANPINGNRIFDTYGKGDNGTLDTSLAEINSVFIRKTVESDIKICLDYRDSSMAKNSAVSPAFLQRHQAPEVCRTVHFTKAWKNLSPTDTVLETTKVRTAPAMTTLKNNPVIAYLSTNTSIASKYYNGTKWNTLSASAVTAADSIRYLGLANNGTDVYMAVLTTGKKLSVYKSASGTSPWTAVGSTLSADTSVNIICSPTTGNPLVSYINSERKPDFNYWNGTSWEKTSIPTTGTTVRDSYTIRNCYWRKPCNNCGSMYMCDTTFKYRTDYTAREIQTAFNSNGDLATVYVDATDSATGYYTLYSQSGSTFTKKTSSPQTIAKYMSLTMLTAGGNAFYLAYNNRSSDASTGGAYVKKATVNKDKLIFDNSAQFNKRLAANSYLQKINVAATANKVFVTFDARSTISQVNVYQLDGSTWKLYGENELPYFGISFYNKNKYYLRGYHPSVAIADNGKVYTLMLVNGTGSYAGNNYGPILMQYVADTWKVK